MKNAGEIAQKYLNANINNIDKFTLDAHNITISFKNGGSISVCADEFELFFINMCIKSEVGMMLKELKEAQKEIERQMDNAKYDYRHDKISKCEYDRIYLPLVQKFRSLADSIEKEKRRLDQVKESKKKAKGGGNGWW